MTLVYAAIGAKALYLMYAWLLGCILAAELSRSKGYGEKPGLGTGLILSFVAPIVWLFVPPKDETAEWHTRKPWQPRRKPKESEMADVGTTSGTEAGGGDAGAGSRAGESRG